MMYVPEDNAKQQIGRSLVAVACFIAVMAVVGFFGVREQSGTAQGIAAAATFGAIAGLVGFAGRRLILAWRREASARRAVAARYDELARERGAVDLGAIALEKGVDQFFAKRAVAWARWHGMLRTSAPPGVQVENTGKVQRGGDLYGLYVITLGIYTFFWIHRVIAELHRHDPGAMKLSAGRAVGLCFVPGFNLYWLPYLYSTVIRQVNVSYRRFDDSEDLMDVRTPVIVYVVLNLVPLLSVGLIPLAFVLLPIPMTMVQGALNRYWLICRACGSPTRAGTRVIAGAE